VVNGIRNPKKTLGLQKSLEKKWEIQGRKVVNKGITTKPDGACCGST